jgi:hypothetical protein
VKLEELRHPGMRRVLEAMKQIKEEAPGLLGNASVAASELLRGQDGGGRPPVG